MERVDSIQRIIENHSIACDFVSVYCTVLVPSEEYYAELVVTKGADSTVIATYKRTLFGSENTTRFILIKFSNIPLDYDIQYTFKFYTGASDQSLTCVSSKLFTPKVGGSVSVDTKSIVFSPLNTEYISAVDSTQVTGFATLSEAVNDISDLSIVFPSHNSVDTFKTYGVDRSACFRQPINSFKGIKLSGNGTELSGDINIALGTDVYSNRLDKIDNVTLYPAVELGLSMAMSSSGGCTVSQLYANNGVVPTITDKESGIAKIGSVEPNEDGAIIFSFSKDFQIDQLVHVSSTPISTASPTDSIYITTPGYSLKNICEPSVVTTTDLCTGVQQSAVPSLENDTPSGYKSVRKSVSRFMNDTLLECDARVYVLLHTVDGITHESLVLPSKIRVRTHVNCTPVVLDTIDDYSFLPGELTVSTSSNSAFVVCLLKQLECTAKDVRKRFFEQVAALNYTDTLPNIFDGKSPVSVLLTFTLFDSAGNEFLPNTLGGGNLKLIVPFLKVPAHDVDD